MMSHLADSIGAKESHIFTKLIPLRIIQNSE